MKAIDPAEIERRIQDLRAVEAWMKLALSGVRCQSARWKCSGRLRFVQQDERIGKQDDERQCRELPPSRQYADTYRQARRGRRRANAERSISASS